MSRTAYTRYPRNWKRVSRTIRRLANWHCERCGRAAHDNLSVHHIGAPFANGKPGDPRDKHDIRRENLIALCFTCHDGLEQIGRIYKQTKKRRQKHAAQLAARRALGIGTGLVPYDASMSMVSPRQFVGVSTAS